jgi:hypothetical protein
MKFPSCASQSFLISSHASWNALQLFSGPHAILGGTVLVPIIKQMGDLRRGHDAMRACVSHLMRFSPNGLPAFQYSTVLLQALAEHGLTKTPSGSTKRICTICRLHLM